MTDHQDHHDQHDHHDRDDDDDVTVNVNIDDDNDNSEFRTWLKDLIVSQVDRIINQLEKAEVTMTLNLEALTAAVANDTSVNQSVLSLLTGFVDRINELLAEDTVNKAELQSLVDQITANSGELADAVAANTPSGEVPPVVVPPVEPPVPPTEPTIPPTEPVPG